ncbi:hypothetical protein V1J52_03020 [Streptomyces sp. TRM 70351]|uniref:hypothetical protein n=1 Tax=Streptomyces sp. TRM 70351 TaxID=3116552 RepID=UPI002E7AD39A|nr:hypothetical protein [Streptomyces sp. TRM 70351]MEE1927162.1 hypothetical protein [Streptomyces sp. TRM 70351]
MRATRTHTAAALSAALAAAVLLTGCPSGSGDEKSPQAQPSPSAVPHGYVEGAEEAAEQQPRLVLADTATGAVHVLDLVTEEVFPVGRAAGVRSVTGDGRFAYLDTGTGAHVVDGGAWTTDHGDHVHYYRSQPRSAGTFDGGRPQHVHSDSALTAVVFEDGTARLFDRTALEDGTPGGGRALTGRSGTGPVIPYREHLLLAGTGAAHDTVEVRDREGAPVGSVDERCPQTRGEAVTRRGVVFGCSDGALLVTEEDGTFTGEKIPYGQAVAPGDRAVAFDHRPGSTTLTAGAGDDAVWVLDVTERTWTRVETGPVAAAGTAGEGTPLLVLTEDGALSAYDPATGERGARTALLEGASPRQIASAVIETDTSRAYVNDVAARKIHEIDYNDGLRRARTFALDLSPALMVETGR